MISSLDRISTRDDLSRGCRTAAFASTLSVGVLSHHAHETLARTLASYEKGALVSCAQEACLFFNEQTEDHPRGRPQALEVCLNTSWWRDRHFKVAVGEGLFTHARIKGAIQ